MDWMNEWIYGCMAGWNEQMNDFIRSQDLHCSTSSPINYKIWGNAYKSLWTQVSLSVTRWSRRQGEGHLGGSVDWASAFSSVHDFRILGWSPSLGSLLSGESSSPSPPPPLMLSLSLTQINQNKILKKKREKRELIFMDDLLCARPCVRGVIYLTWL